MNNSIKIGLQFPLESATLAASYLRTVLDETSQQYVWMEHIKYGLSHTGEEQQTALAIEFTGNPSSPIVFNNAAGVLWALYHLPSALTATERAALILALVPTTDAKTLAADANDAIQNVTESIEHAKALATTVEGDIKAKLADVERTMSDTSIALRDSVNAMASLLSMTAVAGKGLAIEIAPMARRTRNTEYLCPEAAKMYRDMLSACNASVSPHKRFMCVEWRNDYKAFERFFLDRNMRERADRPKHFIPHHEGIICTRLNDPESQLHGQMVYGPMTVMFVSKSNQNFYNRNKRDFLTRLAEHVSKGTISEKEAEFMRKREQV